MSVSSTMRGFYYRRIVDDELNRIAALPGIAAQMAGKVDRPALRLGEQVPQRRIGRI